MNNDRIINNTSKFNKYLNKYQPLVIIGMGFLGIITCGIVSLVNENYASLLAAALFSMSVILFGLVLDLQNEVYELKQMMKDIKNGK